MQEWLKITLAVVSSVIIVSLLIIIIQKLCCSSRRRRQTNHLPEQQTTASFNFQNRTAEDQRPGSSQLHRVSLHHLDRNGTKKTNYYVFRRGLSAKPFFSWSDHPSLVTDAVENGWSRFAFTPYAPSSSVGRSAMSLLGSCGSAAATGDEPEVKITWEVSPGSVDFMQRIRFRRRRNNPDQLRRITSRFGSSDDVSSVLKTALPLPGPPLKTSSFPQEAYFEITVSPLDDQEESHRSSQDDKIELIRNDLNSKTTKFESLSHVYSIGLSIGGSSVPMKLPGTYPGSIRFNSNGSVCLDGMKLVNESDRGEQGKTEKVIGCGYNPSQKKVFFTVDSQLIHEIYCKSEEFGNPLYPTLAANADIVILVNLGQSAFKYGPANQNRTSNPCFIGPLANNSAAINYEDSRELFSMGRIDSQWLNRNATATRSNGNSLSNGLKQLDFDLESEGELFEIVLDSSGKNSNSL